MKNMNFLLSLSLVAGLSFLTPAQTAEKSQPKPVKSPTSQAVGLPPLIDRELLFGNPEIGGAQLSPDGKFITFLKPYKDTRNVWIKKAGEPFSAAKLLTAETKRPIAQYFWSHDSKFVLFVKDNGGDENFNVFAVNPNDAPASGQEVPAARNLTDAKNVRAMLYSVPKSDPDVMYIGLNDRDAAWHDLYKVKISTGERTLLRKNTEKISAWVFDQKGVLRMAMRTADNGSTEILRVDPDGFKLVYSCGVFESCGPERFHKDGKRVYMQTNKGDNVDLTCLVLFDPATGNSELVEADPLKRVDFGNATFSDLTDELISTSYEDDRMRVYFKDKSYEADYKLLKQKLGDKEIGFNSSTEDEQKFLISASSDTDPGSVYLFDRKTKQLTLQYKLREKIDRATLAPMQAIRYKSSDGLEIPAYLTLPKGVPAKNLPTLVFPHGGPWGRDSWGYNSYAQFLANRGYAVLQPNFRASTGYGKKFLNAGNKQWGNLMQDDITWGVKHLVSQGITDVKRVAIMGGSYGGYATLAGVAFTPDVYAAAVAIVAPSNLISLLETIPPYWEAGRVIFHERMGNPNTPEGKAQLARQSPLNAADKIKTPLMVVQGANDPRVNKRESDQIVIALRDRGFPIEYIVAPDEGHGFQRPVNNMAMLTATEKFLAKHLNGRYQEGAKSEVAERLKEITVDPKTVTLAKKIEASSGTPKPVSTLKLNTTKYQGKIELGEQVMLLEIVSDLKEENGSIVALETAKLSGQEMSDLTILDKNSLTVKKRVIKQGPMTVTMTFTDSKAEGSTEMNGQTKPFTADLGGALFADGAGNFDVIGTLPLATGYTTSFRNFDTNKQKVTVKQLKVLGEENVTVPGGSFDAFKVELTSDDDGPITLWIAKDSRKMVKVTAILKQMGGAKLTTELAK